MNGPVILEGAPANYDPREAEKEQRRAMQEASRAERAATGIRRTNTGSWAAVVEGRVKGVWSGAGSKRRAIRQAGTNVVLP